MKIVAQGPKIGQLQPNELGNYKSLAGNYATGVVARSIGLLDVVAQFIGLPRRFSDEPKL